MTGDLKYMVRLPKFANPNELTVDDLVFSTIEGKAIDPGVS